jgi:hypothetical protein
VNLLLVSGKDVEGNDIQHVMYIKDIEIVTKLHICLKCSFQSLLNMDVTTKNDLKNMFANVMESATLT